MGEINLSMNGYNNYQIASDVLRNKIEIEEETLQLLVRTGLLAEDQVIHYQMVCAQQQIVSHYRELLEKLDKKNKH